MKDTEIKEKKIERKWAMPNAYTIGKENIKN
jgi:hypothetical protein